MINKNYKLLGVILGLATLTAISTSFALASDLRLAVANNKPTQNKPVIRGTAPSSSIHLQGSTSITKSNPKITLSLKNSDVQPVLRMFADKAGLNIVFHESAKGNVTLDLVNVPLNDAFRMVLQVSNLTYHLDGKTLMISSQAQARSQAWSKQELISVPVNYVDATTIANFLNKNIFSKNTPGLSNWDVVSVNVVTNELLVFGTKNDLDMVKKIVNKFDVAPLNTTFTVKHTTPAEMAELVCNMLGYTIGSENTGSGSGSSSSGNNNSRSGRSTGFAANIQPNSFFSRNQGVVTGFASSGGSKSGSSSGSSSGGSSGSGSGSSGNSGSGSNNSSNISIGKNIVACTVVQKDTNNDSSSSSSSSSGNSGNSSSSNSSNTSSNASGSSGNSTNNSKLLPFGKTNIMISYFPQRGTIQVLGGSKAQLNQISEFIKKNDIKQPQAMMDITILELNETSEKDLENTWSLVSKYLTVNFDLDGNTGTMLPIHFGPNNPGAIIGSPYVEWAVKYLISNKKARVVANPKILITNGETSTIDLSEDYIETVDAEIITSTIGTASGVQRTYNVANDKGLKFELTPFISPEGYITLNLSSEYATLAGTQEAQLISGSSSEKELVATLLNHRNIDLKNVRIKDNETLIIGGLVKEDESKNITKIPFLGDIPIIGVAFRSTSTTKVKNELLIMLTPKILWDTEDIGKNKNNNENAL